MTEKTTDKTSTLKKQFGLIKSIIVFLFYFLIRSGPYIFYTLASSNILIFKYLAYIFYPLFLLEEALYNVAISTNNPSITYNLIYDFLIAFMLIIAYKKDLKEKIPILKDNIKVYIKKYIKIWIIALVLMSITEFIVISINGGIAENEEQVRSLITDNAFLTIIITSIFAPFIEELIFRFSLRRIVGNRKYLFILISGLLFGTAHVISYVTGLSDLLYIIPYAIPGFVLAYVFVDSDNIYVPMGLHFLHNTITLLLQLLV